MVDAVLFSVVAPDIDVEAVDDVIEVADVVGVRVGQYNGIESIGVVPNFATDIELAAHVDEDSPRSGDQKDVTRERLDVPGEIANHTRRFGKELYVAIVPESWPDPHTGVLSRVPQTRYHRLVSCYYLCTHRAM